MSRIQTETSKVNWIIPLFLCVCVVAIGQLIVMLRFDAYDFTVEMPNVVKGAEGVNLPYAVIAGLMIFLITALSFGAAWSIGRERPTAELAPLVITVMLSALGLIFLARLGPILAERFNEPFYSRLAFKQALWIATGIAVMVFLSRFLKGRHYLLLADRKYLLAVLGSSLIVFTAVFGTEINGRRLWLSVSELQFQTIEFVKPMLLLFAAGFFAEKMRLAENEKKILNWGIVIPFGLMVLFSLSPVFLQGDLGPTFLMFCVFLTMFYMATSAKWLAGASVAIAVVLAWAMYSVGWPGMLKTRVAMWLEPFTLCEHVASSVWAISSGGFWGTGLAAGLPQYVPTVYSDFIFSGMAEEFGFVGVSLVMALFGALSLCGYKIACRSDDPLKKFIAAGITTLLSFQAITILGGISGMLPLTGITLPFISYGGSATIANFGMLGILINISGGCDERE